MSYVQHRLYSMKYLLVVAHPDDETLGAGASMWKWVHSGHTVDVCIMCTEAKARAFRPSDEELGDDTNESNRFLGVNVPEYRDEHGAASEAGAVY